MAKIVKRVALDVTALQVVQLPAAADNLRVDRVGDKFVLWADAEAADALTSRTILMIGDNGLLPSGSVTFIATVFKSGSTQAWHVYEDL